MKRGYSPIRLSLAVEGITSSEKGDKKRDIVSKTIHRNLENILTGTYTLENLRAETGFSNVESLQNFLRIYFFTKSLKKIALTIKESKAKG